MSEKQINEQKDVIVKINCSNMVYKLVMTAMWLVFIFGLCFLFKTGWFLFLLILATAFIF
jgi:hypothetical protein